MLYGIITQNRSCYTKLNSFLKTNQLINDVDCDVQKDASRSLNPTRFSYFLKIEMDANYSG